MLIRSKQAISLVELGVAITVAAIMTLAVAGSFKIIESAKITAILQEGDDYQKAVLNFYQRYDCLPGDCSDAKIAEYFPSATAMVSKCSGITYSPADTLQAKSNNLINTPQEVSCASWQLQVAGMIPETLDLTGISSFTFATNTTTGVNIFPAAKDKDISYRISSLGKMSASATEPELLPLEAGYGSPKQSGLANRVAVVVTKSFDASIVGHLFYDTSNSDEVAGISVARAKAISQKGGTGLPYTGRIIAGRDRPDNATPSASVGCTLLSAVGSGRAGFSDSNVSSSAIYNTAQEDAKCIMAFVLPDLSQS